MTDDFLGEYAKRDYLCDGCGLPQWRCDEAVEDAVNRVIACCPECNHKWESMGVLLATVSNLTAERDALKAERDDLLRMNLNLTEECERKHRLIEGLKVDRDSRDEEIDTLKGENEILRAKLEDAAKTSDGVWEWVPKPRYDALRATIERVREILNMEIAIFLGPDGNPPVAEERDWFFFSEGAKGVQKAMKEQFDAVVHLENTNKGNDQDGDERGKFLMRDVFSLKDREGEKP